MKYVQCYRIKMHIDHRSEFGKSDEKIVRLLIGFGFILTGIFILGNPKL